MAFVRIRLSIKLCGSYISRLLKSPHAVSGGWNWTCAGTNRRTFLERRGTRNPRCWDLSNLFSIAVDEIQLPTSCVKSVPSFPIRELWCHNNQTVKDSSLFSSWRLCMRTYFYPLSLRALVVGISSALSTSVFTVEIFSGGICSYTKEYWTFRLQHVA